MEVNAAFAGENALREGELHGELASRFEELENDGLTGLFAGEAELLGSVKDKVSGSDDKEGGDSPDEKEEKGEGGEGEKGD